MRQGLFVWFVAALVAAGAARADDTLVIRGDHASTRAFARDAASLFKMKRGASVRVEATGTIGAIESGARGEVDVVATARPGDDGVVGESLLRYTPVAWDALSVIVFPANPVKSISLEQLRDVLSGTIKDWQELGGKPGKINLYAIATPMDGIEYSVRKLVLGSGTARTAAERWYLNSERLEEAVTIDPAGFAISLYSDVADNALLRTLAIEGVQPSPATVQSGEYLLASALYVGTLGSAAPGSTTAGRFVEYLDDPEVRKNLRAHHLIPWSEGRDVTEAASSREKFLADRLGYAPVAVVALPPAPAPRKTQPINPVRLAQAEVRHASVSKQPAGKSEALPRATAAAQPDKTHECLEQALCT